MSLKKHKLENLILYLANHAQVKDLGLTKLYKLVFFCDVAHLREHGVSITGSEYIKFQHGPVPSRGERALKDLSRNHRVSVSREILDAANDVELQRIKAEASADISVFNDSEKATIEKIVTRFGYRSAKELSALSHEEPSWAEAVIHNKLDPQLMLYGREEDPEGL